MEEVKRDFVPYWKSRDRMRRNMGAARLPDEMRGGILNQPDRTTGDPQGDGHGQGSPVRLGQAQAGC